MKRMVLSLLLGVASLANSAPNIVFILVDDLGYTGLGCYGNTFHETPNIDQLAAEGLRFTEAYSACAVCSPTRASIQTGQYPIRFGITDWIPGARKSNTPLKEKLTEVRLPLEATTIAEALKQNGYKTAFIGKWHLNAREDQGFFPEDQGYDIDIGGSHKGTATGSYFAPFNNPKMVNKPTDHYLTDRFGDEAVNLINGFADNKETPFFLMLCFHALHTPIEGKKELTEYYQKKLDKNPNSPWKNPKYAAMVHCVDVNVGRVLQALKEHDLVDDTIVVFFSDNGGLGRATSNYPLSLGKGYYHEGGIRVPLIVRYPGHIKAATTSDVPVISNDLFPTLLDLAGLPLMPECHKDGVSLKPVINGEGALERKALYWHYPHYHAAGETPSSTIRMGDYKLIRHYEDGSIELFNVRKDIRESNNLAATMPEKVRELELVLDAWLTEQNAYIPGPDPDYDPSKKKNDRSGKKKKKKKKNTP